MTSFGLEPIIGDDMIAMIFLSITIIGAPTCVVALLLSHKRKMRTLELQHQRDMTKTLDDVIRR